MVCNVLVEKILILYHIGPSANLKLPGAPGSGKVFLMYNLVRPGPHVSSHRAAHISPASFVSGQRIRNQAKHTLMACQRIRNQAKCTLMTGQRPAHVSPASPC